MGLDMNLYAKRYLWARWDDRQPRKPDDDLVDAIHNALPESRSMEPRYVIAEAMYWRKANAIHGWFVENCQDGEDDCREYEVERSQLEALRDLCKDILEHPDAERDEDLEPTEGFFFGWMWFRTSARFKQADLWYFKPARTTSRLLSHYLKTDDQYQHLYKQWKK